MVWRYLQLAGQIQETRNQHSYHYHSHRTVNTPPNPASLAGINQHNNRPPTLNPNPVTHNTHTNPIELGPSHTTLLGEFIQSQAEHCFYASVCDEEKGVHIYIYTSVSDPCRAEADAEVEEVDVEAKVEVEGAEIEIEIEVDLWRGSGGGDGRVEEEEEGGEDLELHFLRLGIYVRWEYWLVGMRMWKSGSRVGFYI